MGLMKKLTSSIVASSLVLGLVGSALAAPTADQTQAAFDRLSHYGIVKGKLRGDNTIDPALGESITRAELVTIIVRAMGQESAAKILNGAPSFGDVPTNEWYSGYVALAKNMAEKSGFPLGYEDGTFKATKNVSTVEALAFMMKFLGVKPGTGATWAEDTVKAALEAGVITSADSEAYLSDLTAEANRGLAFGLADTVFATFSKLAGGKTVYQTYVDTQAPVVTIDKVEPTTTAASVKISGKASGDYIALMLGTEKITVNEDGTFSIEAKLAVGENNINVIAVDRVGNEGTGTVSITRTAGTAAKIQATLGSAEVVAGGETELAIKVLDANDAEVAVPAADIKVTTTEGLGSYADGKFTAGTKAGTGTITAVYGEFTTTVELKVVAGELAKVEAETSSVAPGSAVKLLAKDQYGNAIEGATFAKKDATSLAFIEGSLFTAPKAGQYVVVATVGEKSVEGTIGVFGDVTKFKIAAPEALVANGETEYEVTVTAQDDSGNTVKSFAETVKLTGDFTIKKPEIKAVDGVATFTVTVPEGLQDVDIDVTASYKDIENTTTVTAKAQTATSIKIDAGKYLGINEAAVDFTGSVSILDQKGVEMKSGETWDVKLKLTGAAYFNRDEDTEIAVDATGEGSEFDLERVDGNTEGDVTITASAEGLESATATVKAVYAYAPKNVVVEKITTSPVAAGADDPFLFKVGLTDRNGVPVKADSERLITLTFESDSYKQLKVAYGSDQADAEAPGTALVSKKIENISMAAKDDYVYVGVEAAKVTGDIAVTAAVKNLTTAQGTVSFKAGAIADAQFKNDALNILGTTETPVEIQLVDQFGNSVKKKVKVAFSLGQTVDSTNGLDPAKYVKLNGKVGGTATVTTDEEGKASVKIQANAYSGEFDVKAEIAKADAGTAADIFGDTTLTIVNAVAKRIVVSTYEDNKAKTTFDNDAEIEIRAVVTDNNGIVMTDKDYAGEANLSLKGVVGETDITQDLDDVSFDWNAAGYWTTTVNAKKAGTFTLKVVDSSSVYDVEGPRTVSFRAGGIDHAQIAEANSAKEIELSKNKVKAITIQLVDADGNLVAGSKNDKDTAYTINFEPATGATGDYASIRKTENGGGGASNEITIPKYKSSVTFYIITNYSKGNLVIVKANGTDDATYTVEAK